MNKTVLITGVAGLLGSRLADWVIENHPDIKVVGIDDLSGGYKDNIHPEVDFWQMNLVDHPIENCFEVNKFDYVFHFAAYAAEGLSPFIRTYNYKNNLISTAAIVNQCIKHNVKRLVFTSSMADCKHKSKYLGLRYVGIIKLIIFYSNLLMVITKPIHNVYYNQVLNLILVFLWFGLIQ